MPLPGLASTTSRLPKRPPIPDQRWRLPPAPAVRHHCRTPNPIESFSPVGPASSRKRAIRYRSSTGPSFAFGSACHHQCLVPTGKQMPALLVPDIEPLGVNTQKPFHPRHKIGLRRLKHQMKMIPHQTIRMHLPLCLAASLRQGAQKPFPIRLIPEAVLPPVTATHHVINRPLIFHSQHARPPPTFAICDACVNS